MINKSRLIKLTQELIQINSENPPGNEKRIAQFLKRQMQALGLQTKIYEFKKNRTNILGILSSKGKKCLLLSPHLDTVPAGSNWKFPAFSGKIYKNRIYGRGASDCKGNIACGLEAIRSIIEDRKKLDYNLIFAATADEETGSSLGLAPLLDKGILRPNAAVILDAANFNIIITQKGLIHLYIKIIGKKAHGAFPDRGINAIEIASKIIKALKNHKFSYKKHSLLKGPTINIGTIKGGDKINIVADWCEIGVDVRFLPGMKVSRIISDIKNIIQRFTKRYTIELENVQDPFSIDKNHFLVNNLKYALSEHRLPLKIKGSEGATVITFFQKYNIPAVATGFAVSRTAHTTNEYITIDNLMRGARLLEGLLLAFKFK